MDPVTRDVADTFADLFPRREDFLSMGSGAVPGTIDIGRPAYLPTPSPSIVRSAALFTNLEGAAVVAVSEVIATGARVLVAAHECIVSHKEALRGAYTLLGGKRGWERFSSSSDKDAIASRVIRVSNSNVWQVIAGLPSGDSDGDPSTRPVLHVDNGLSGAAASALAATLFTHKCGVGLFIATCPWGHCQVSKIPIEALPLQRILAAVGMQFTGGCARGKMTSDFSVTSKAVRPNVPIGAGRFSPPPPPSAGNAGGGGSGGVYAQARGSIGANPVVASEGRLLAALAGLVGCSFPPQMVERYVEWFMSSGPDGKNVYSTRRDAPTPDFLRMQAGAVPGAIVVAPPTGVRTSALFTTNEDSPRALIAVGEVLATGGRVVAASHECLREHKGALRAAYAILAERRNCGGKRDDSFADTFSSGYAPSLSDLEKLVTKVDNTNAHSVIQSLSSTPISRPFDHQRILHVENNISDANAIALVEALMGARFGVGLFIATCPWGHCQVSKIPIEALPLQRILAAVGMQFTGGYAHGTITGLRSVTSRAEVGAGGGADEAKEKGAGAGSLLSAMLSLAPPASSSSTSSSSSSSTAPSSLSLCDSLRNTCEAIANGVYGKAAPTAAASHLTCGGSSPLRVAEVIAAAGDFLSSLATPDGLRHQYDGNASPISALLSVVSAAFANTSNSNSYNNTNTTCGGGGNGGAPSCLLDLMALPTEQRPLRGSVTTAEAVIGSLLSLPGLRAPNVLIPSQLRQVAAATTNNGLNNGGGSGEVVRLSLRPRAATEGGHSLISTGYYAAPGEAIFVESCAPVANGGGGVGGVPFNPSEWLLRIGCHTDVPAAGAERRRLPRITSERTLSELCTAAAATAAPIATAPSHHDANAYAYAYANAADAHNHHGGAANAARPFLSCAFGGLVYLHRRGAAAEAACAPFEISLRGARVGSLTRNVQIFASNEAWESYECRVFAPEREVYSPMLPPNLHMTLSHLSGGGGGAFSAAVDAAAAPFPPMMEGIGSNIIFTLNVSAVIRHNASAAAVAAATAYANSHAATGTSYYSSDNGEAAVRMPVPSSPAFVTDRVAACVLHMDAVVADHHALSQRQHRRPVAQRVAYDVTLSCGFTHSGYPIMAHADPSEGTFLACEQLAGRGGGGIGASGNINSNTSSSKGCDGNAIVSSGNNHGCWGLYHELGHNHQRPAWTFEGTTEVTVNLFTLHAMLRRHGTRASVHPWMREQRSKAERYMADVAAAFKEANSANRFKSSAKALTAVDAPSVVRLYNTVWCTDPGVALCAYAEVAETFGWAPFAEVFRNYEVSLRPSRKADSWETPVRRSQFFFLLSEAVKCNVVARVDGVWGVPIQPEVLAAASHLPPFVPAPLFP